MSNAAAPATEGPDRTDSPSHVAIIMDGNGRWAAARGLPRAEGHRRGVEALRRVVRAAHELGVLYLTIFSFSSENWSRPATEIGDLFGLLRRFIRNEHDIVVPWVQLFPERYSWLAALAECARLMRPKDRR